ncbi:sacsin-like [Mercenaria mercenaria]|uniref:sacsin-like n=1 Tax=Mercenaria mercenaria TaxID=6596 RepID=UPI00234E5E5F|nr:sacsin-like [Mercenaria mercenaria]XP_053401271.1 sacsin-like [Mercenaria mercenaria]
MASTSDGVTKTKAIRYSRMKQPPLIKLLRGILSDYPDGGQILKELIQNAEDAGATEIKILSDNRKLNDDAREKTPRFTKFFKGPALCVYNDAVFTEKDWENIQMIYSSMKQEDPMKVGRFGLGFKSVFHITDFPSVISGNTLLLIDPQQSDPEMVNASLDLCSLNDYAEDDIEPDVFWNALEDTFGLSRNTVGSQGFQGTVFWFPLREEVSDLSETLYNGAKVRDLFDALKSEASNMLIFLKNIEHISLHIREENDVPVTEVLKVEIEDTDGKVGNRVLIKGNKEPNFDDEDIYTSEQITIHTVTADTDTRMEWLVVNYFVRKSASEDFRRLIKNKDLNYSPYVGVARPLDMSFGDFEGHVFCFLPLPREGERLTGLPVHVNGFFALSQNRHHMKWQTEEQEGHQIDDKSILWNKALIEEALPKAYEKLILEAIKKAEENKSEETAVLAVYKMMPLHDSLSNKTHKRWSVLSTKLYERLEMKRILFVSQAREWMQIKDVCFATFSSLPESDAHNMQDAMTRCLHATGLKHSKLPGLLFEAMQIYYPYIKDLTPESLALHLQVSDGYRALSCDDKLRVLSYLLSDVENYKNVQELELLPLASGQWTTFDNSSAVVYLCSDNEMKMFPGKESIFVMQAAQLGEKLTGCLENICKSDMYQIKKLSSECATSLLVETVEIHFRGKSSVVLTTETNLTYQWLKNVWQVLMDKRMIHHCKDIPLVPVLVNGTWSEPHEISLAKLTDPLLLLNASDESLLSSELSTCLQALTVKVISSLPEWIPADVIQEFTYQLNYSSVSSLLGKIYREQGNQAVKEFNTKSQTTSQIVETLREFSSHLVHVESDVASLLVKLKMFKAVSYIEDHGSYSSVSDVPRYITETVHFPVDVPLPITCIKVKPPEEMIAKQLGAEFLSAEKLVLMTLQDMTTNPYDINVMNRFMMFVLDKFNLFEENEDICTCASRLSFVKAGKSWCKPSELFDPFEPLLQNLFIAESFFPEVTNMYGRKEIHSMKVLGLKEMKDIDASTVLQVARTLDSLAIKGMNVTELSKKSLAFLEILCSRPNLLQDSYDGSETLGQTLKSLKCMPVKVNAPLEYPIGLPWFSKDIVVCKPSEAKNESHCLLVGATMPVVECATERIIQSFQWDDCIELNNVVQQLLLVQKHYNVRYKPDFMRTLNRIYLYFSQHENELKGIKHNLSKEKIIWTGTGFVIPEKVIVTMQDEDLELKPHLYTIPEEFHEMHATFIVLGCNMDLDNAVLIKTLKDIKLSNETPSESQEVSAKRDIDIVIRILHILADRKTEGRDDFDEENILMLTESGPDTIILQKVTSCIFIEDQEQLDEEEEDAFFIVNSRVPVEVATALGVKSLKRKTINAAAEDFSFEEWGQSESLTTRIKTLLMEGYKDGLSVPKELIQNADDAGATEIRFMFDERNNNDAKDVKKLLSSGMCECQGPALWVYNNSVFKENDMENITKLNGATKAENKEKIGKFGLGFCSVYNVTDVPSFLSGQDLVIFDPHESYIDEVRQKRGTGLRIRLSRPKLIHRHKHQFKPYNSVFGCNVLNSDFNGYAGTLFRLPLRTEAQAMRSDICSNAYSSECVISLLNMIVENAGNLLLFTQNVMKLQIFHLSKDVNDPSHARLLYSIEKECVVSGNSEATIDTQCILKRVPRILELNRSLVETHQVKFTIVLQNDMKDRSTWSRECLKRVNENWLITWATGTGDSLQLANRLSKEKALPLAAVALPVNITNIPKEIRNAHIGFYKEGYLFCFLPLPIKTGLPVHINGCFSVRSDRTDLLKLTEDDKCVEDIYLWNKVLMEDALVYAYLHLLEFLVITCQSDFNIYSVWPLCGSEIALPCIPRFFEMLFVKKPKLFRGSDGWFSIDEIVILDPVVRSNISVGDIAFDVLMVFPIKFGKNLVDLPGGILEALKNSQSEQFDNASLLTEAVVTEKELIVHFLNNLSNSYWKSNTGNRNKLLLYTLHHMSAEIEKVLQGFECIPSEPDGCLCKPSDLVDPNSDIAGMFAENDGRFPLKSEGFSDEITIEILVRLGMNRHFLPDSILIERCKTLKTLEVFCKMCRQDRFKSIMRYLAKNDVLNRLKHNDETVTHLKHTEMLPVKIRPTTWIFKWKADESSSSQILSGVCDKHSQDEGHSLLLDKPMHLFRQKHQHSLGSVALFVDEDFIKSECGTVNEMLYEILSVEKDIPPSMLIDQLLILPQEYENAKKQLSCVEMVYKSVTQHLFQALQENDQNEDFVNIFESLSDKNIVLIGQELVKPCNIALKTAAECPPFLFQLPVSEKRREQLYRMLGVKERFTSVEVIEVLKQIKMCHGDGIYERTDIICDLLKILKQSMDTEGKEYKDMQYIKDDIVAPDEHRLLHPTYKLVVEDSSLQSKVGIHILHECVPLGLAKYLGVKSKKKRLVEGFSKLIPFGQKEMLATRLKGLLQDYPCDSGIMKELLQNADDAKASVLHFIKDYRQHPTERIFGSKALQGPALCVYNDSYFNENDLNGIHYIGEGSKKKDPTKTGQYGVGFNAVYHLTDVPSFLTKGPGLGRKGTLCIFDPLRKYLTDHVTEEEPGVRCDVKEMIGDFPDVLSGYLQEFDEFASAKSTMFRLPLRMEQTDLCSEVISKGEMDRLLEDMKKDMFEMLLFVKNVRCVKISNVIEDKLIEEYCVSTYLSPQDILKRNKFFSDIKSVVKTEDNDDTQMCQHTDPFNVAYNVTVQDSNGMQADWHVVQRFGYIESLNSTRVFTELKEEGDTLRLPLGGVAIPLMSHEYVKKYISQKTKETHRRNISNVFVKEKVQKQESCDQNTDSENLLDIGVNVLDTFTGKLFCFLPLPGVTTLPACINGHFALDRARRALWPGGLRQDWNQLLLKDVVAICWAVALRYVQSYTVENNFKETLTKEAIGYLLELYHTYLPKGKTNYQSFASYLVKCFYEIVVATKIALFPTLMPHQDQNKVQSYLETDTDNGIVSNAQFVLRWVALSSNENITDGVFNNVFKEINKSSLGYKFLDIGYSKASHILERTLKILGVNLIETPSFISKVLDSYGLNTVSSTPLFVSKFCLAFGNGKSRVKTKHLDQHIEKTLLMKPYYVRLLHRYILLGGSNSELLLGLPLCLTNDGILRKYCIESPVFITEYADLLPKSSHLFLHTDVLYDMQLQLNDLFQKGLAKHFCVQDLIRLLPDSYPLDVLTGDRDVEWDKTLATPVSTHFISRLYEFLVYQSREKTELGSYFTNFQKLQTNILMLADWTFLPSVQTISMQERHKLIRLCQGYCLFNCSGSYIELTDVIRRLNLPALDKSVFDVKVRTYVVSALNNFLASTGSPFAFLKCLHHYKSRMGGNALSFDDGVKLMSFFDSHMKDLQASETISLKDILMTLPLFPTHQNNLISIEGKETVFVLPDSIPAEGLDIWAANTGIVLLQETDLLKRLYKFLGLSKMDVSGVYLKHLLPRFSCLPDRAITTHITYIRDYVLPTLSRDEGTRNTMVCLLANIPFITIKNQMKRVNELYKADHPVFKIMLDESCFLPREYSADEWINFIELLGFHTEVSDEEIVRFAIEIAQAGPKTVTQSTVKKSKEIFKYLLKESWEKSTLEKLKNIKFVVPKQTTVEQKVLQVDNGQGLISTDNAVKSNCSDLCWTSMKVLPTLPFPRKMVGITESLGIIDKPPINAVISHCQNICDKVSTELTKDRESNPIDIDFARRVFEKIYEYMCEHIDEIGRDAERRLKTTPVILLPDEQLMVCAKKVVVELAEEDEIKPYLFRSPGDFGKYRHLFCRLGSSQRTDCSVYLSVLQSIKEEFNGRLPPKKLEDVAKALKGVIKTLKRGNDSSLSEIDVLYIPNRQHCLVKSTALTVSDNGSLEKRLSTDCGLEFFLGFPELQVEISDPVWPFKQLPPHLKPKILSTIIKEVVCADKMVEAESIAATRIERFLHNPDLIQGIIRLVKHQLVQKKTDLDENQESLIKSNLSNVAIRKVTGLKTCLSYESRRLEGSEKQKSCFIEETSETLGEKQKSFKLFFQTSVCDTMDIVQEIMEEDDGLIDLVEKCTMGILEKTTYKYFPIILRCVYQSSRIKQILDDKKITAYNISYPVNTSAFPTPGTCVPEHFFPFLERSMTSFKDHEFRFLALDIGEFNETEETYKESYIYVHIVRELERERTSETVLGFRYEVDVGTRSEEYVVAYMHRLYKFMPQNTPVGDELVVYDSEPVGTVPFDENCNRIKQMLKEAWKMNEREKRRIIHRLQLKWHQDKNIGNEEYAMRVYNYMNFLIRQFELGVIANDTVDERTGREAPDMTGSAYESMRVNIQNTGHAYVRRWREDFHNYISGDGNFLHRISESVVHPDVNEAKVWLRQAVNDYKMAVESLGAAAKVRGYNWICYQCHQSCEKALKAAMYAKDANRAARRGHSLSGIARELHDLNLTTETERLERELGNYFRMRYPDSVIGKEIPSDVFEEDQAQEALKKTKRILDIIEEMIE